MLDWDSYSSADEDWDTDDIDVDTETAARKEKAQRAVKAKVAKPRTVRVPKPRVAPKPRERPSAAVVPRLTCDACQSTQLTCVDSRPEPEGRLRRYKCRACGGAVYTQERKIT